MFYFFFSAVYMLLLCLARSCLTMCLLVPVYRSLCNSHSLINWARLKFTESWGRCGCYGTAREDLHASLYRCYEIFTEHRVTLNQSLTKFERNRTIRVRFSKFSPSDFKGYSNPSDHTYTYASDGSQECVGRTVSNLEIKNILIAARQICFRSRFRYLVPFRNAGGSKAGRWDRKLKPNFALPLL